MGEFAASRCSACGDRSGWPLASVCPEYTCAVMRNAMDGVVVRSIVALALAVTAELVAEAQTGVALDGIEGAAVFNALAQECYEAGMWSDMPGDSIMDCSDPLPENAGAEEGDAGVTAAVVRRKVRFTLVERAGAGRIGVEAWTEIEELGTVIEEPVTSEEYLRRVQGVLAGVVTRLRSAVTQPWAGRYDTEQDWHLDAHLRAVGHCDANLATMTSMSVGAQLEAVGLRPLDADTRDRCEQLFTHIYEWALVRPGVEPTVEAYVRYRASLPPEQRTCSGQLAWDASCSR
jgi:hypothetical protein